MRNVNINNQFLLINAESGGLVFSSQQRFLDYSDIGSFLNWDKAKDRQLLHFMLILLLFLSLQLEFKHCFLSYSPSKS